jgi:hypothetical protein
LWTWSLFHIFVPTTTAATTYSTDHTFNTGDHEFSVDFIQQAHATMLDGWIENRLSLEDEATADLYGGVVNSLYLDNNNVANVYPGGYINTYAAARGTSVLNFFGGRLPDNWLEAEGLSTVNFYVSSYQFDPSGGAYGVGRITGSWVDNQPFLVDLHLEETASHLIFHVPEPSSQVSCVLGVIALMLFAGRKRQPLLAI